MGTEFGKYRLESLVARGGMAEVFRATPHDSSIFTVPVCVKRMRPEYSDDPEFSEMFAREARIAASLDHPGIVKVFDFDRHLDRLFIVMEYVDGMDLRELLKSAERIGLRVPVGFVVYTADRLLLALDHFNNLVFTVFY